MPLRVPEIWCLLCIPHRQGSLDRMSRDRIAHDMIGTGHGGHVARKYLLKIHDLGGSS